MAWTTVAQQETKAKISKSDWNAIADSLGVIGGAWTAYTPTASYTGTDWTPGNAVISGAYLSMGKWLMGRAHYVIGSTTTENTGYLALSLPTGTTSAGVFQAVTCAVWDNSGGMPFVEYAQAFVDESSSVIQTSVRSTEYALATDDTIAVQFSIEIA